MKLDFGYRVAKISYQKLVREQFLLVPQADLNARELRHATKPLSKISKI